MVSARNRKEFAVIFSDIFSELEFLIQLNQQLEAEKAALTEKFMQLSSEFRDLLQKLMELLVCVKEMVQSKELGPSHMLNEAFGELANLISEWLEAKEDERSINL